MKSNMSTELDHIQKVWERQKGNSAIYDFLLSKDHVTLVSASKGFFKAHLDVSQCHVNSSGSIHGSVSATIVDWAGGLAIATHGWEKTGASIEIHVTYMAGAKVGDVVEIEGIAHKIGKDVSFTSVIISKIVNGEPGPIVAKGSHSKYFAPPAPPAQ